ncbi:MAG: hypothetical protein V3T81_07050, partial [Thermoanaerobaculia bacterium]
MVDELTRPPGGIGISTEHRQTNRRGSLAAGGGGLDKRLDPLKGMDTRQLVGAGEDGDSIAAGLENLARRCVERGTDDPPPDMGGKSADRLGQRYGLLPKRDAVGMEHLKGRFFGVKTEQDRRPASAGHGIGVGRQPKIGPHGQVPH